MEITIQREYNTLIWKNQNQEYTYTAKGIENATEKNGIIFIEIYNENCFSYRYIDITGKDLVWYDEIGRITLFDKENSNSFSMEIDGLSEISARADKCWCMSGNTIKSISYSGKILSEIYPPSGYTFYRFANDEGLEVICSGNPQTADSSGRNDWLFRYDFPTNSWEKDSIAY